MEALRGTVRGAGAGGVLPGGRLGKSRGWRGALVHGVGLVERRSCGEAGRGAWPLPVAIRQVELAKRPLAQGEQRRLLPQRALHGERSHVEAVHACVVHGNAHALDADRAWCADEHVRVLVDVGGRREVMPLLREELQDPAREANADVHVRVHVDKHELVVGAGAPPGGARVVGGQIDDEADKALEVPRLDRHEERVDVHPRPRQKASVVLRLKVSERPGVALEQRVGGRVDDVLGPGARRANANRSPYRRRRWHGGVVLAIS